MREKDTRRRQRWRTRVIVRVRISPEILTQNLKSGMWISK
jgi:hypothetical protein